MLVGASGVVGWERSRQELHCIIDELYHVRINLGNIKSKEGIMDHALTEVFRGKQRHEWRSTYINSTKRVNVCIPIGLSRFLDPLKQLVDCLYVSANNMYAMRRHPFDNQAQAPIPKYFHLSSVILA